jgi:peptide/nickel transport system permease protein
MKHTLQQVFRSGKFLVGFFILLAILLTVVIYPIFVKDDPLEIIGQGSFMAPGTYVSTYDSVVSAPAYKLTLPGADDTRIANKLGDKERSDVKEWLIAFGIPEDQIDINNTEKLLDLWKESYDPNLSFSGWTFAKQRYYQRLDKSLDGLLNKSGLIIASPNVDTGVLEQTKMINQTDYVNVKEVANVKVLPLGTDNFGSDVLTKLVKATSISLLIGLQAGLIATFIGLLLGLIGGYMGGEVDDVVMFGTNLFTVIPTFVLLILISYSIGQEHRGAAVVAIVIGVTSWTWTARSVRAQVISLRNRDHVNLSKLSGHSIMYIIMHDILPYIASYVVMAFILQISSAILSEASLSILGLGPKTSEVPTLGLMMNWAMVYQAQILGKWWAYFPVLLVIALITFSMNLMNTGLDQVFNPALRD